MTINTSNWVKGTVAKIEHWKHNLFSLTIDAEIKPYQAGQFVRLGLEQHNEMLARAFSFVNAPNHRQHEFYVVAVEGGALSPKLKQLKPGDHLWINNKPNGYFILDEVPDCRHLWLLATGTGISPYLSMIQARQNLQRFNKIILVHASRHYDDFSYLPLMQQLQQQLTDQLEIQLVTSREQHHNALYGRLPALIESGELEQRVGLTLDAQSSHVMLCGNPGMIQDCRAVLAKRQMHKHLRRKPGQISSEHYW